MPNLAVAGHGALIAIELDPTGAPAVFTTVAELNGDITPPALNRPETEVTSHNNTIDYWITGRLGRDALTFSVNFVFDHETHDHLTGLQQKIIDNELFGVRYRGPGGTTGNDEWIMSCKVTNIVPTNPVREGARTAEVTLRPTGPQKIDGVVVGTDLS